jgi:hypothetical protein
MSAVPDDEEEEEEVVAMAEESRGRLSADPMSRFRTK